MLRPTLSAMRTPSHPWSRRLGCAVATASGDQWQNAVLVAALSLSMVASPLPGAARMGVDMDTPLSVLQQQERTVETLFREATPSVVFQPLSSG